MKDIKKLLSNKAEKIAKKSVAASCEPFWVYQPTPPACIREQMLNKK